MNYKEILKKYWFVLIVAVLLIAFVAAWTIDTTESNIHKEAVQTKVEDGKYVLFSINGENKATADDFYESINTSSITNLVINQLFEKLADKEISNTEQIKTLAANAAQYYVVNNTPEQLEELMRSNGLKRYGNLTKYFEGQYRQQELIKRFLVNHYDDIVKPYIEDKGLRGVSHILIKVASVDETEDANGVVTHKANPTEEETKKLNEVLEALKTTPFDKVAAKYSDDGSATQGGFLAFNTIDEINSTYVKEFADCASTIEFNKQSEVITSEFGYHIIYVEEANKDTISKDTQLLYTIINDQDSKNLFILLDEYCKKNNVEIIDEDVQAIFDQYLKTEEETEESTDATEGGE